MMAARQQRRRMRLMMIAGAGAILAAALGLVLFALNDQIAFFQSPSDIASKSPQPGQRLRLGGLVKEASVIKNGDDIRFVVTDMENEVSVTYTGFLPDLFREGQGVVADGVLNAEGVFVADTILAKHDENYVPAEVQEAMKDKGIWRGQGEGVPGS